MALPTSTKEELKDLIVKQILASGLNACPPMFIGIGIGQTLEGAALLSKKALFSENKEDEFANEILAEVNEKAPENYKGIYALDVKILSRATHIASMPVGITLNCHSVREAKCIIKNDEITYLNETPDFIDIKRTEENNRNILHYQYYKRKIRNKDFL